MSESSAKVMEILNELEILDPRLTMMPTEKVVDILLDKEGPDEKAADIPDPGQFSFDIEELRRWQKNNNERYKISYDYPIVTDKRPAFVIKFFKRVIRKLCRFLGVPVCQNISAFNASVTNSINALYKDELATQNFIESALKELSALKEAENNDQQQIKDLASENIILADSVEKLTKDLAALSSDINRVSELRDQSERVEGLNRQQTAISDEVKELGRRLENTEEEFDKALTDTEINFLREVESRADAESDISPHASADEPQKAHDQGSEEANTYHSLDYFKFENEFRGSRRDIKERQKIYIPYLEGKGTVLDLGCGRGEMLEILKENHINAVGIDSYTEFVSYCNLKDLTAHVGTVPECLRSFKDKSVGGIFAGQLVEHLSFEDLTELCCEAYRVLEDGGCFIAETPNPTCLSIYMNSFYLDPSHNKPVHPKTLQYLMEQQGFNNAEVLYTEQSKTGYRLPLLSSSAADNLEEFNDGINFLSDVIFGSQDYAIIGYK